MTVPENLPDVISRKGAEPSIIEGFGIRGLYGYQSISLASDYAATILVAKNGTGKTTLLGALDAFLRVQISRLRNLEFSEIYCKFRSEENELILKHDDVVNFLETPTDGELAKVASRAGLEPSSLFAYITEEWIESESHRYSSAESKIFGVLLQAFDYNRREIAQSLKRVRASLIDRQPNIAHINHVVSRILVGVDIVYLPTYRRVELALRGDPRDTPHRRRRPKFDIASGSLFTGEIQFGTE